MMSATSIRVGSLEGVGIVESLCLQDESTAIETQTQSHLSIFLAISAI
jgi:hypothetical protein